MIYFYHKKTLLDAPVLTQKGGIPQKVFAALGNWGKKRSESRQGRKNTPDVSAESPLAPTSCAARQGSADAGRRPGTSEAAVRGRFTASEQ